MTDPDAPTPESGALPPGLLQLAARALRIAELDSLDRAVRVVERIHAEYGPDMVVVACLAWCDELLRARPEVRESARADRLGGIAFCDMETGADHHDADQVPPPVRWAGRFLHARARFDEQTGQALVAACQDDAEWGNNVVAVLQMVALGRTNLEVPSLLTARSRR